MASDSARGSEAFVVTGEGARELATHYTAFKLEKRAADVEKYVWNELPGDLKPVHNLLLRSRLQDLVRVNYPGAREVFSTMSGIDMAYVAETARLMEILRGGFLNEVGPYDVLEWAGNMLVTSGTTVLWNLTVGLAGTAFSNANCNLGVGNANTAAAVSQTQLLGASTQLVAMNATYPSVAGTPVAATATFQATFASAQANFSWLEVGTFNGPTNGTSTMLNRSVPAGGLGTKASGASWTLTETVSLS